ARRKRPRGAECRRAVSHECVVVLPLRASRAGVGLDLQAACGHRALEAHLGAQALHGRVEAAADVPVELVVLIEERDLARGTVDDLVDLLAALDRAARLAGADACA